MRDAKSAHPSRTQEGLPNAAISEIAVAAQWLRPGVGNLKKKQFRQGEIISTLEWLPGNGQCACSGIRAAAGAAAPFSAGAVPP
jgi:hypothetical protein